MIIIHKSFKAYESNNRQNHKDFSTHQNQKTTIIYDV